MYHFYWNKWKIRLSGAYNNCEIFLLEISVSHLFGKIFSSIIHYRGLKILLQWQSLYLFLDNWHPLLADLECFFDDNACDPAGFAEWLHKQRQIVKCGKEKAIFIILETGQPTPGPILNVISAALHFNKMPLSSAEYLWNFIIIGLWGYEEAKRKKSSEWRWPTEKDNQFVIQPLPSWGM